MSGSFRSCLISAEDFRGHSPRQREDIPVGQRASHPTAEHRFFLKKQN
jgi:hypothetical protein